MRSAILADLCASTLFGAKEWVAGDSCDGYSCEKDDESDHIFHSTSCRVENGGYVMRDTRVAQTLRFLLYKRECTKSEFTGFYAATGQFPQRDFSHFKRFKRVGLIRVERRYDDGRQDRYGRPKGRDWVKWRGPSLHEIVASVSLSEWDLVYSFWERRAFAKEDGEPEAELWLDAMRRVEVARKTVANG